LHYVKPFYCVNDNEEMNGKAPQIMHCVFCYNSPINASNLARSQAKKRLIFYYKTNGIVA